VKIEVLPDPDATARQAAANIAAHAWSAVNARGRFVMAVSGGHTPLTMLQYLADQNIPWPNVHVVQVDERVAPTGHPDRNLTHLKECLLAHASLCPEQIHEMPVGAMDLETAALEYAQTLRELAGSPPVLDLIHLGLGADGHTASLLPDDPVLDVTDVDVALTNVYQGWPRMTLTYPILGRSRYILWLVTGREKADSLVRLFNGDVTIPAGRVSGRHACILADFDAAVKLITTGPVK
jgi:6-phosphogluconolactonase